MRTDFDWQHHEGRSQDGDKLCDWVLVHSSGRLLAKVMCPQTEAEYHYQVYFFPGAIKAGGDNDVAFMDLMSAQRFCEEALATFGVPAAQPKKTRVKRSRVGA